MNEKYKPPQVSSRQFRQLQNETQTKDKHSEENIEAKITK